MANTLKFGNGEWYGKKDTILAYNDENYNYKPLPFSFERASSGTVVNKAGLIETVGSGEPRIDYSDDANGALLLEPQRSNLVTYSEDFTQWSKGSATITETSSSISTFGNYSLFETTSLGGSISLSTSVSGVVTFSIYTKKGTAKAMRIRLDASTDANCWVNLENGTEVGTNTGQSLEITDVNNGFYRIAFTANVTSLSLIRLYTTEATTTADEIGNIYIYAAQLEQGSYATSYIPTQGSTVTRLADACNNGGNEQVINSTEGVLYAEISALADDSVFREISLALDGSNRITLGYNDSLNTIFTEIKVGNVAQTLMTYTLSDSKDFIKMCVKYKQNDFALWVNGFKVSTDNSGIVFNGNTLNKLNFDRGTGGTPFYGNIKDVRVYNTALTDSELQKLTTI